MTQTIQTGRSGLALPESSRYLYHILDADGRLLLELESTVPVIIDHTQETMGELEVLVGETTVILRVLHRWMPEYTNPVQVEKYKLDD